MFELIQAIVEYSPILDFYNIKNENGNKKFPQKTLIHHIPDDYYDMRLSKIKINRLIVSEKLEELEDGYTLLCIIGAIFLNGGSAHGMSITKTCNRKYIFFDSNAPYVLELSSKEEVCEVMEFAANFYQERLPSFPVIKIINATETTKEVIEHYERESEEDKPDSYIGDIIAEAVKQGMIGEEHQDTMNIAGL